MKPETHVPSKRLGPLMDGKLAFWKLETAGQTTPQGCKRGVKEREGLSDVVVVMWLFVLLLFWWVLTMAHDRQAGGPETRAPASPLGSAGVARVALQWPQC